MFGPIELERLFPSIEEAQPRETYLSKLDNMPPVVDGGVMHFMLFNLLFMVSPGFSMRR